MNTTTNPETQIRDQLDRPDWLGTDRWPFALRRYRHRDDRGETIDIHYTDEGDGPTLVFVHAGMWSFIWRDAIATLRSRFRCITLDFPGTGLSGGAPGDIDLAAFPAVLEGVLDECGVDDASLLVHDLGGVVGVLTAARRPERVAGLAAVNSFGWPPDRFALRTMLRLMGSRQITWTLGTVRLVPRLSRTASGVGKNFSADDREAFFGPYRSRANARNFHRAMRSASRSVDAYEQAERALLGPLAHLPMLTIFGEKNDPFGFAARWKELFPRARQWTVADGNHFPMCDDPTGFAHQVTSWYEAEVAA